MVASSGNQFITEVNHFICHSVALKITKYPCKQDEDPQEQVLQMAFVTASERHRHCEKMIQPLKSQFSFWSAR